MSFEISSPTQLGSVTRPRSLMIDNQYRWGTYVVRNNITPGWPAAGKRYYNKAQAILEAERDSNSWLEFDFHDDVYARAEPTVEPRESLQELYRQRAQHIRDRYDYVILSFSSGCDSTTVLHSFLHNNIPIDEVFSYGPFSTQQGHSWQYDPLNQGRSGGYSLLKTSANNYREIDLIGEPYLRELSKHHRFKYTKYDWTQDLVNGFRNSDWVYTETRSRLAPSTYARNRLHNGRSHLGLVDQGKRVAFVYGIDKPRVILRDNQWYFSFLDIMLDMGVGPAAAATGQDWDHDEFFYWTPDAPKIVIKQAHMIKNYVESRPELRPLVEDAHRAEWNTHGADLYYDFVKRLIYPTYDHRTWQTRKPTSPTYTDHDYWFIQDEGLAARRHWLAGLEELENRIPSKYFNGGSIRNGFQCSWSRWHRFGESLPHA